MEKKEGFLVFFGGLSVFSTLLVICLACVVLHNYGEVESIRAKLNTLENSCSRLRESPTTGQDEVNVPQNKDKVSFIAGERLKRSSNGDDDNGDESVQELLETALSKIVEEQLEATLDCGENDQGDTECTLKPGPKGDRGEQGPRGEQGERGEKGDRGDIGPQGQKGQLGYPGYKGQKGDGGAKGDPGVAGPTGLQGAKGAQGTVALRQVNCEWIFTDTCGHSCGRVSKTATCPVGKYVAGFGISTWDSAGRYHTRVYCCLPN